MKSVFIGLTGASGTIYAKRLIEVLSEKCYKISITATANAIKNATVEDGFEYNSLEEFVLRNKLKVENIYSIDDLSAKVSSGSNRVDYTFIVPASMGFIARASVGISGNLIERVFDVALKEGRKVGLIFREAPLSAIHLENMLKLSRLGVAIMPAAPAFYHRPESVDDMVNFIVGKFLDLYEIENNLYKRW